MYVAKEGFEPPIASPELAVLPLHYLALLNCLSSQTGSTGQFLHEYYLCQQ